MSVQTAPTACNGVPATSTTTTRSSATNLAWIDSWARLPVPTRQDRQRTAWTWPQFSGTYVSWTLSGDLGSPQCDYSDTAQSAQCGLAARHEKTKLTATYVDQHVRLVLEAISPTGLQAVSPTGVEPCEPTLRTPGFTAVVSYPVSDLARLERSHRHSFTLVTRVAATDVARSIVRDGTPDLDCSSVTQYETTTCTDNVAWKGTVRLTYRNSTVGVRRHHS